MNKTTATWIFNTFLAAGIGFYAGGTLRLQHEAPEPEPVPATVVVEPSELEQPTVYFF